MTEAREVIAKWIMDDWDDTANSEHPAPYEQGAARLLTALRTAGFAVVPVEPTSEQAAKIHAAVTEVFSTSRSVWSAMIKAAQGGVE